MGNQQRKTNSLVGTAPRWKRGQSRRHYTRTLSKSEKNSKRSHLIGLSSSCLFTINFLSNLYDSYVILLCVFIRKIPGLWILHNLNLIIQNPRSWWIWRQEFIPIIVILAFLHSLFLTKRRSFLHSNLLRALGLVRDKKFFLIGKN